MFTFALQRVRATGTTGTGTSRADQAEITRLTFARFQGVGDIVHADALNAVKRAIAAREGGLTLTNNPNDPRAMLAHDYVNNPGIDRRRGQYEYRVIVRGTGQGNTFETMVIIRSRARLSGQQVFEQAEHSFIGQENLARQVDYSNRLSKLGNNPTINYWIVAASRHAPD